LIIESGLYCFEQAIDREPAGDELNYEIYIGRAKFNMFLRNFGHVKDDCLVAKKHQNTTGVNIILARSRFMLEKWDEAIKYATAGLKDFPDCLKLKDILK
jgi:hypothetical protein